MRARMVLQVVVGLYLQGHVHTKFVPVAIIQISARQIRRWNTMQSTRIIGSTWLRTSYSTGGNVQVVGLVSK